MPLTSIKLVGLEAGVRPLISLAKIVPAVVPSLFHSSFPRIPSSAVKYRVPLILNRLLGDELLEPVRISLTNTGLPVLSSFHSSWPLAELEAVKKSVPLTSVKFVGEELPEPETISMTLGVPVVGSIFQSSVPVVPELA